MDEPNLDYINQLADGDESFKQSITAILKKEFPIEMAAFYKSYHSKDFKETANIIHKIKYKFSLMGLEEDFELATYFECEVKSGCVDLFPKFEGILEKIDQYIKSL